MLPAEHLMEKRHNMIVMTWFVSRTLSKWVD